MDAKRIEELRQATEHKFRTTLLQEWRQTITLSDADLRELLDAYESLQRIAEIADDFHPDSDRDAPLALQEMRDALQEALPEGMRK